MCMHVLAPQRCRRRSLNNLSQHPNRSQISCKQMGVNVPHKLLVLRYRPFLIAADKLWINKHCCYSPSPTSG